MPIQSVAATSVQVSWAPIFDALAASGPVHKVQSLRPQIQYSASLVLTPNSSVQAHQEPQIATLSATPQHPAGATGIKAPLNFVASL